MTDNTKAAELADLMECHAGFARTETGKLLREAAALLRASEGRVPEGLARNDAKELLRAGVVCHDLGRVSVSAVQRRLAISWNRAEALCGQLIQLRLVDGLDSSSPHLTAEPHPPAQQAEPVGEAGTMPGTSGFTMACFHADKVPLGTKLYTSPPPHKAEGAEQ